MTHTDQHSQSPGAPPGGPRTRSVSVRSALGSAGAVATVAGAAVLGVLTLAVDDPNEATRRPLAGGQDNSHTAQSSTQDQASPSDGRAPACWWTSKVNTPVFPADDLGGPPTPDSVLIFERCNGEWTGNIDWSHPGDGPALGPAASSTVSGGAREHERFAQCVKAETRSRALSTSDDGLPNAWEAGNIAAKCYLERSHQDRDPRDP